MKEQPKKLYNRLQKNECNRLQKYAIVCKKKLIKITTKKEERQKHKKTLISINGGINGN